MRKWAYPTNDAQLCPNLDTNNHLSTRNDALKRFLEKTILPTKTGVGHTVARQERNLMMVALFTISQAPDPTMKRGIWSD